MKNYKSSSPCVVCNEAKDGFVCLHHIKTRGAGGTDEPHNLMPLCALCHTTIHRVGLVSMSKKHASVHNWLLRNGWELAMGRWIRADKDSDHHK